jgi:hypothetical protein
MFCSSFTPGSKEKEGEGTLIRFKSMRTEEKSQRFKVNRSREQTPTLEILWSGEEFESNRKQNLEKYPNPRCIWVRGRTRTLILDRETYHLRVGRYCSPSVYAGVRARRRPPPPSRSTAARSPTSGSARRRMVRQRRHRATQSPCIRITQVLGRRRMGRASRGEERCRGFLRRWRRLLPTPVGAQDAGKTTPPPPSGIREAPGGRRNGG